MQSSDKRKLDNGDDHDGDKRKGRKKGFVWSHVVTHEDGRVSCMHCGEPIKINFGEKVERLRKHFIKNCTKNPFQKDSKEYEELIECFSTPTVEQKKKNFAGKVRNSNKVICYNIDFVSSVLSGSYQSLTVDQIGALEQQGNRSSNWAGVRLMCPVGVSGDSSLDKIHGCSFNGNIIVGLFVKNNSLQGGISVQSGLYNSNFSGNCVLSDNCYVWNTAMLVNVYVGRNSCIVGCGNLICEGHTSFGTQRSISIGAEVASTTMRRELVLNVKYSYSDVVGCIFHRAPDKIDEMEIPKDDLPGVPIGMHSSHSSGPAVKTKRIKYNKHDGFVRYDMTIVCDDVEVTRCTLVRNAFIGSYCVLRDSAMNNSTSFAHCEVSSSHLTDSVIHQSCKVLSGAQLSGVLMFPHSSASSNAKITDTVLGPDSSVSIGECKNSLLGPHVGFHHQALLIATTWVLGRGNISYGAMIGANHTTRNNDQESFPGEGMFFGLACSIRFPFNTLQSPYSIVAAGTSCAPQKISFPFSLICNPIHFEVNSSMSSLKPGWVLYSNAYFLERSMYKYTRRRRSVEYRTDLPIFRPSIADMVADARNRLLKYKESSFVQNGRIPPQAFLTEEHVSGAGQCVIQGIAIETAIDAYTQFLHRYALHGLLYLVVLASELPAGTVGAGLIESEHSSDEVLEILLGDVRSMQSGMPSIGDHLHQMSAGSAAPPATSSAKVSASVSSIAEPAATETPSLNAQLLLGSQGVSSCCILTDTHNPVVRSHQLRVLREEFPEVDVTSYIKFITIGQKDHMSTNAIKVKQLLGYLSDLEINFFERVKTSKFKDISKAAQIVPDYLVEIDGELDETIESASNRSSEISRVVQYLIN